MAIMKAVALACCLASVASASLVPLGYPVGSILAKRAPPRQEIAPKTILYPAVHWDHDRANYQHLVPQFQAPLYYAEQPGLADKARRHKFLSLDANFTYPSVVLEHSKYVSGISCNKDDTAKTLQITFDNDEAFDLARASWNVQNLVLLSAVEGCGRASHTARTYWRVDHTDFRNVDSVAYCSASVHEIELSEGLQDTRAFFGTHHAIHEFRVAAAEANPTQRPASTKKETAKKSTTRPASIKKVTTAKRTTTSKRTSTRKPSSTKKSTTVRHTTTITKPTITSSTIQVSSDGLPCMPTSELMGGRPAIDWCLPDFEFRLDTEFGPGGNGPFQSAFYDVILSRAASNAMAGSDTPAKRAAVTQAPSLQNAALYRRDGSCPYFPIIGPICSVGSSVVSDVSSVIITSGGSLWTAISDFSVSTSVSTSVPTTTCALTQTDLSPWGLANKFFDDTDINFNNPFPKRADMEIEALHSLSERGASASGNITLYCVNCQVVASFDAIGVFVISSKLLVDFQVQLAGSLAMDLNIGGVFGDFNAEFSHIQLLQTFSLGDLEAPGIVNIGPEISFYAGLRLNATATGQAIAYVNVESNDMRFNMDFLNGTDGGVHVDQIGGNGAWSSDIDVVLDSQFLLPIGIGVTASISPIPDFNATAEAVNAFGIQVQTEVDQLNNNDGCENGLAWSIELVDSAWLNFLGHTVLTFLDWVSTPIVSGCVPFAGSSTTTATSTATTQISAPTSTSTSASPLQTQYMRLIDAEGNNVRVHSDGELYLEPQNLYVNDPNPSTKWFNVYNQTGYSLANGNYFYYYHNDVNYNPYLGRFRTNIVAYQPEQSNCLALFTGFNQPLAPRIGFGPGVMGVDHFGDVMQIYSCTSPALQYPKLFLGVNVTQTNAALGNSIAYVYTLSAAPNLTCSTPFLYWNSYLCSQFQGSGPTGECSQY